ncbi:MAG: VOC family protein, partial [Pseudomonadota bacterium]
PMDHPNLPEGYHTITPYFTVKDADGFMAFVEQVFGATQLKLDRYDDGRVQHARMKIGDSIIMLNQSSADYPPNTSQMHLYVADSDATFDAALKHGATPLMQPNLRPHGDRMAGIKDPCGNVWWLATPNG